MRRDKSKEPPSTAQQLLRVIKTEPRSFPFRLAKNAASWAWAKYILKRTTLTRTVHGSPMSLDLTDNGISRSLLLVGDREREHRFMLEKSLRPGQTVLDIGANIGYYVLMELSLVGPSGHVIAIEPAPANIARLQHNLKLNGSPDNVSVQHAAIAKHDGSVTLHLSALSNVHSLIAVNTPQATGVSIKVPAVTLQALRRKYDRIDLIRMDIEGYEEIILQSLLTIAEQDNWRPQILMELHPPKYNHATFSQLLSTLYSCRYRARFLASSHLDQLKAHGCTVIASIPTDGTVRHIATDVSLPALLDLYPHSRAVLLTIHS